MLELIVFLCGAIVMILEMVGSRVVAPYIGTSLIAWTGLIGIVLASLSLGYWWGGRLADRKPHIGVLSLILTIAGVFIALVAIFNVITPYYWGQTDLPLWVSAVCLNAVLFGPASFLLGMVSPYAIRLRLVSIDQAGTTAGRLYALSTVGSILGTFIAGFYLIAVMGSTMILVVLAIMLEILSIAASREKILIKGAALVFILAIAYVVIEQTNQQRDEGLHDLDTAYNRVLISSQLQSLDNGRSLITMATAPQGVQSAMYTDDSLELALNYTRFFSIAEFIHPKIERALILGGGGYSFPRYLHDRLPGVRIDVVELDPGITHLARRFFALDDQPGLSIYHEDGRTFLNRTHEKYDVIFVDAFGSHYSIPFHLTTQECIRRIEALLAENGIVIVNTISAIDGDGGKFFRSEYLTYHSVFPYLEVFPLQHPENLSIHQNVVLIAARQPIVIPDDLPDAKLQKQVGNRLPHLTPEKSDIILTDNFAPVDNYMMWSQ